MLTDDELVAGFEAGTLERLPHADHVRLGLAYLDRLGYDQALRCLADGLLLFATLKGHPEKFHVTMTRAWLDLLDAARQARPGATPAEIVAGAPDLLDPRALDRHYSPGRLDTDAARTTWVEPDLVPLAPPRAPARLRASPETSATADQARDASVGGRKARPNEPESDSSNDPSSPI